MKFLYQQGLTKSLLEKPSEALEKFAIVVKELKECPHLTEKHKELGKIQQKAQKYYSMSMEKSIGRYREYKRRSQKKLEHKDNTKKNSPSKSLKTKVQSVTKPLHNLK